MSFYNLVTKEVLHRCNSKFSSYFRQALRTLEYSRLLKVIILHRYFSRFLNCANGTKLRKAYHMITVTPCSRRVLNPFLSKCNYWTNLEKFKFFEERSICSFCAFRNISIKWLSDIHLNFRVRGCFEQGVPWHSGNYTVWIHSETRTWHGRNI